MTLPEAAYFGFMTPISKMEEDEMVNEQEFARIFKLYTLV
jgi:hypothetical protein